MVFEIERERERETLFYALVLISTSPLCVFVCFCLFFLLCAQIENGNNFILFQFPVELPELPKSMEGQEKARKIGKLQIFSDGTTEMNLGGVVLDVSPGTLSECRHEVRRACDQSAV